MARATFLLELMLVINPNALLWNKKMSRTFKSNLTHFFDEKGVILDSLPKRSKKLSENLGNIVSNATIEPRLAPRANVICWGGTFKNKCKGHIDSSIDLDRVNIVWHCLKCGDNGRVTNWDNSFWDLGYR